MLTITYRFNNNISYTRNKSNFKKTGETQANILQNGGCWNETVKGMITTTTTTFLAHG